MATPPIINIMSRAAEKAARSLKRDFYEVENLQISVKGPGDFVSAADKRAEQIIYEELLKARPDAAFLMEESGEVKGKGNSRFIIDPLDGTNNFLHGVPYWCISIALEEAGKMTAAVILDPIGDEMFYATKGGGAWMRGNKRLRVSGRKDMAMCLLASNIPLNPDCFKEYQDRLANIYKRKTVVRSNGATALDLAYVAAGRYDGFYQGHKTDGPKPWDLAAGTLIVREAGGMVTQINGQSDPVFHHNVLAGNEHIHAQLKDIFNT
jgi:myo-inositol-1(or 4)-monophosphatase